MTLREEVNQMILKMASLEREVRELRQITGTTGEDPDKIKYEEALNYFTRTGNPSLVYQYLKDNNGRMPWKSAEQAGMDKLDTVSGLKFGKSVSSL